MFSQLGLFVSFCILCFPSMQMFSVDDVILYEDQVWGNPTSLINTSKDKKVYNVYTHMETKELTGEDQYNMVVHHTIS